VNPLIGPTDLGIHRTICNYTETSGCVKPCQKIFLGDFLKVWKRDWLQWLASSKAKGLWSLSLFLAQGIPGKAKPGSADTEEKFREAAGIVFGGAKCIFPMGGRRPNWRILLHLLKVE